MQTLKVKPWGSLLSYFHCTCHDHLSVCWSNNNVRIIKTFVHFQMQTRFFVIKIDICENVNFHISLNPGCFVLISHLYPLQIARFLYWVLACSQKCEGCLNSFTFMYLYPKLDKLSNGHFSCITKTLFQKKKKKKLWNSNFQLTEEK
jgi:hypothetical protein